MATIEDRVFGAERFTGFICLDIKWQKTITQVTHLSTETALIPWTQAYSLPALPISLCHSVSEHILVQEKKNKKTSGGLGRQDS